MLLANTGSIQKLLIQIIMTDTCISFVKTKRKRNKLRILDRLCAHSCESEDPCFLGFDVIYPGN
jgi:DNA-binding Xre family transcriptional regulator